MRILEVIGTVAPPVAVELAWRAFWNLGTPERVHPRDAEVHARARRSKLTYADRELTVYEWGSGPRVLVVHGWRSRASRFGAIIDSLAVDHTVVSFDAPGNGDSPGKRTTALEYAAIVGMLGERYGRFDAIIAHSIGVVAAMIAVRELNVDADRIVTIAGVHDFDHVLGVFARRAGLTPGSLARFTTRFENWLAPLIGDPWPKLISELPPTASVPIFAVHDRSDREVDVDQSRRIADAHPGTRLHLTDGLGHARLLRDPGVVAAVAAFVREPVAVPQLG